MASFGRPLGSHWAVLLSTLVEISLVSVDNLWKSCGKVRDGSGKVSVFGGKFEDFNWRGDDDGVAVIVFFDLLSGIGRNSDELSGILGGFVIGFAKGLHEEFECEADEGV